MLYEYAREKLRSNDQLREAIENQESALEAVEEGRIDAARSTLETLRRELNFSWKKVFPFLHPEMATTPWLSISEKKRNTFVDLWKEREDAIHNPQIPVEGGKGVVLPQLGFVGAFDNSAILKECLSGWEPEEFPKNWLLGLVMIDFSRPKKDALAAFELWYSRTKERLPDLPVQKKTGLAKLSPSESREEDALLALRALAIQRLHRAGDKNADIAGRKDLWKHTSSTSTVRSRESMVARALGDSEGSFRDRMRKLFR